MAAPGRQRCPVGGGARPPALSLPPAPVGGARDRRSCPCAVGGGANRRFLPAVTGARHRRGARGGGPAGSCRYSLAAVVSHPGRGMDKGPYNAYCRDSLTWMLFDDARCAMSDAESVADAQAYLLFYEVR